MESPGLFVLLIGVVMGVFIMGATKEFIGPNSGSKIKTLQSEYELNLPRNQECVMQFVPEKK